jgi:hypothetical protein
MLIVNRIDEYLNKVNEESNPKDLMIDGIAKILIAKGKSIGNVERRKIGDLLDTDMTRTEIVAKFMKESLDEKFTHLIAKFTKDNNFFYLWQTTEGGYQYELSDKLTGKVVERFNDNVEKIISGLQSKGYKHLTMESVDESFHENETVTYMGKKYTVWGMEDKMVIIVSSDGKERIKVLPQELNKINESEEYKPKVILVVGGKEIEAKGGVIMTSDGYDWWKGVDGKEYKTRSFRYDMDYKKKRNPIKLDAK